MIQREVVSPGSPQKHWLDSKLWSRGAVATEGFPSSKQLMALAQGHFRSCSSKMLLITWERSSISFDARRQSTSAKSALKSQTSFFLHEIGSRFENNSNLFAFKRKQRLLSFPLHVHPALTGTGSAAEVPLATAAKRQAQFNSLRSIRSHSL